MVRNICRDIRILSAKCQTASVFDTGTATDLVDTIIAHRAECVGMAANMIGVLKKIIVFQDNGTFTVMFNPVIVARSEPYKTREGCLSLNGERETVRYMKITVEYQNGSFKKETKEYSGYTAQIIQHEIDHTNGIII